MIDSHHHLWDTGARDHPWMDGPWADPLRGRFDLARYAALAPGVESIVVQALADEQETRELLRTDVAGVVGWTDLTAPDAADRLAALRDEKPSQEKPSQEKPGREKPGREKPGHGKLVGIRHLVQDEPDPAWLARTDVRRGLRAVGEAGLVFDLLVKPPQAGAALDVVRALPEVSFVLDHAGKPDIAGGVWEPWASWITSLAAEPNVTVKLSGLVTEAGPDLDAILPYAAHVLESFGYDRVMYGSDWPVCTLAASYAEVRELAERAVPAGGRDAVFGETARRVYRLG